MACRRPYLAGLNRHGKVTFSPKQFDRSRGEAFRLPCGQCLECRLDRSREWAIRVTHESQFHEGSSFITLTYRDPLPSPRLQYDHFQDFLKRLREREFDRLGSRLDLRYIVCGEYGPKLKRPHWHAVLLGYWPHDARVLRTTDLGHTVFRSKSLDQIWGYADRPNEIGFVSFEDASYVARYSAKKLVHGLDHEHDFHPIFKCSRGRAIGRLWIQKYADQVLSQGYIRHPQNGAQLSVPRYYEKWLLKNKPNEFIRYLVDVKGPRIAEAERRERRLKSIWFDLCTLRGPSLRTLDEKQRRAILLDSMFNSLKSFMKD